MLVTPVMIFNNLAVLVELLVAQVLFAYTLPRRPHVWRNAILAIGGAVIADIALAAAFYGVREIFPSALVNSIANFMLLFVVVNLVALAILDVEPHIVIAISICAYAIQHIASAITYIGHSIREALPLASLHTWLAGELLRIVIFALTYYACFRWFSQRFDVTKMRVSSVTSLVFLTVSTLSVTLGLSSYASTTVVSTSTFIILRFVSILVCVMILLMFHEIAQNQELSDELAFVRQMNDLQTHQYELLKNTIDATNVHYHDLKHQIARIRASSSHDSKHSSVTNEVLDEISREASTWDSIAKTGNASLDVVLTHKSLECTRKNIHFTYMIDATCVEGINDHDIYSLFGNALDNAIEATEKIQDEDKRVIKLTGTMRGALAHINIVNYFEELQRNEQGEILTTKSDFSSHGYGLKSMRMIVEKLGGDMTITTDEGIFDLHILLPSHA
ncbi:ATP-binding protein [Alloscardovia criceti]|uniref:ATP-binding protein n=1 Tax=Alloscardovia criceti TaxID=356828 RepID=UPI0003682F7A|nr:ATP-binding protein [Alloscardovia criceti]